MSWIAQTKFDIYGLFTNSIQKTYHKYTSYTEINWLRIG